MNNSSFSSLLKAHLLNLNTSKITCSPQTFAWYQSEAPKSLPPLSPPPPQKTGAPSPTPQPKLEPPKAVKSGFTLHPKKELQTSVPKTLLEQLRESIEGVTFFEEPALPKKVLILCTEEEKPLVEKLSQAIDQKLLPCKVSSIPLENHLIIATKPTKDALYTLPPLEKLQELSVKQTVWKEIKTCLSKYC